MSFKILYLLSFIFLCACSKAPPLPKSEKHLFLDHLGHFKRTEALLIATQHQIQCIMLGGSTTDPILSIDMGFLTHKIFTKDEARTFLLETAHQIIRDAHKNPTLLAHFGSEGFDHRHLNIQLYLDKNHQQIYWPNFSSCALVNGKVEFFYHKEDEKQPGFYRVEKESYQEAISILEQQGKEHLLLPSNFYLQDSQVSIEDK